MSSYSGALSYFVIAWARVARVDRPPASFYPFENDPVGEVLTLLIFAPLIESLMLVGVFEVVRRVKAPEVIQVLTAALVISELHVWPWWPHAVIVLPSFCIQAASYLYWRGTSWKTAYWIVVTIHALNNVVPALYQIAQAR